MPAPDPLPAPRQPLGGGAIFVACLLLGVGIGYAYQQVTIGFFAGAAVGIAAIALLALRERS